MQQSRVPKILESCSVYLKKLIGLCYRRSKIILLIVFILLVNFLIFVYASTTFYSTSIRNVGAVKTLGVGVYWDENCSRPVTAIEWGLIDPGSAKNVTIYVVNEGKVPVTINFKTENWDPADARSYMNLTWNYSGDQILPNEKLEVLLTLTVSADIDGISNFSFDIVITAVD